MWVGLTCFLIGVAGAILSLMKVIGAEEPQLVLQLSWAALWFVGFELVQTAGDRLSDDEGETP